MEYTPIGDISKEINHEGGVSSYDYDLAGRLIRQVDTAGNITEMKYSPWAR